MNDQSNSPEHEDSQSNENPAPEFSPPSKKRRSLLDTIETPGGAAGAARPEKQEPAGQRRVKVRKSLLQKPPVNPAEPSEDERPGPSDLPPEPAPLQTTRRTDWLVPALGWVIALTVLVYAVYLWQAAPVMSAAPIPTPQIRPTATARPLDVPAPDVELPPVSFDSQIQSVSRESNLRTIIPNRSRTDVLSYIVDTGDAIFSIADQFNVSPETILWANYDLLNDNPDFLEVGMELNIPPVDGVYYQWQEGDTLTGIASEFEAEVDDILEFSGNNFDLADPRIEAGQWVMVPDGHREFRQWLIPTINRGNAGVNSAALGPGACTGSYSGAVGSGAFIWPSNNHTLSGNDYWSGHLAIDIGAVQGDAIFASDAGVVVFSGWANGGYGYTVVVDHGNGYQTLYAHLSSASAYCGMSVGAGTVIGAAGSTGNSTGTHLHFEVRLNGGFINPWFVLPPP